MRIDVTEVEAAIGIPAQQWKGRCFEIASLMVKHGVVKGRAVYGHWTGIIQPSSYFGDRAGMSFCNHGWVLLDDGETVVDPTRWVFEDKRPYIFVGSEADAETCDDFQPDDDGMVCTTCGHLDCEHESGGFFNACKFCMWPYDEGGNKFRHSQKRPPPEAGDDEAKFDVLKHLSAADAKFVKAQFSPVKLGKKLTWPQAHWLATLPYDDYDGRAHRIYQALKKAKALGLVPIDNEMRAKREAA